MKYRLFLAVTLPKELQTQVVALQQELSKLNFPVEWQKPEKLHMTINFLGTVQDRQVSTVIGNLDRVISQYRKFSLKPHFLETLYRRHEQTMIYLSLSGGLEELKDMQKATTSKLNELEFPQAIRFMPHISIGEVKRTDPTTTKRIIDTISDFDFTPMQEFEVTQVTMFNSMVSKAGSVYQRICDFLLS